MFVINVYFIKSGSFKFTCISHIPKVHLWHLSAPKPTWLPHLPRFCQFIFLWEKWGWMDICYTAAFVWENQRRRLLKRAIWFTPSVASSLALLTQSGQSWPSRWSPERWMIQSQSSPQHDSLPFKRIWYYNQHNQTPRIPYSCCCCSCSVTKSALCTLHCNQAWYHRSAVVKTTGNKFWIRKSPHRRKKN